MKCSKCGSRDIDFQESIGQSICVNCGTVLEENTIESGDRSHVVGQYISASCSKPYSGGRPMGGHGESRDPRDATLVNARRAITQVAGSLRLPPLYIDRAYRLYQLALQRNFIFGRKQLHVVATCLYIICRQEKSPHLLIDFSDALQINVYVLGKSFLQFSKVLNLNLPVVDPSLYIHRYATRLDLGESRASVVATSLRIITRLKKDWITTGRRPDGICALAMLVSARAHDFDVNQDVICKLFRVSPDLLRRRIEDFRSIPSAQLTLEQFHTIDAELEYDPPSYIRNVVREATAQAQKYEYGDGGRDGSSSSGAGSLRHVRLALPGVKPARAAPTAVSRSSSIAIAGHGQGPGRGYGERKSADGDGSDNDETAPSVEDDADNVMRDPESLISDEVFQQLPGRANQRSHSSGQQGQSSSSGRGKGGEGRGRGEEEESSDEEEIQMQPALGAGGVAALRRQQEQLYQQYARQEEQDVEEDDYHLERDADGAVVVRTKIADVDIAVPVPGQRKRRRMTDTYMLRIQQRKDLYEDVYQQVLQGCEGSASQEGVEALQREAQAIEDATHGVGGWGDQQSRIKERRVVLCVEKGAIPAVPGAGGASGSGSSSSAGAAGSKLKFRKLNNGADASIPFGAAVVKLDTDAPATKAATAAAAKDTAGSATGGTATSGEKGGDAAEGEEGAQEGGPAEEDADNLEDMLGGELGRYLLSEEERQKRAIIWEKAFRPFMDERESRRKAKEQEQLSKGASDRYTQGGKLRRKYTRKAQAAGAAGAAGATTTSQAVLQAQQQAQARSSKKINYDALKGVFGQNGGFAPPNPAPTRGAASATAATADLASSQAYLDSIMGIGIPGVTPVPGAAPAAATVGGSAAVAAGGGFQKDVRRTALGSSIAKTSQRGAQKSTAGSLLTAGTALSTGAGRGSSKLGPAFAGTASSVLVRQPATAGSSSAAGAAAATTAAAAAQGYAEDLGDADDGEEDQLLYEGGGGDDGDYDDYDDEYY